MRIAVIPERYGHVLSPCATIRIASFFDRLSREPDWQLRYLLVEEVDAFRPDIIIWHRTALSTIAAVEHLAQLAARTGARLIYDLDDNLLDLEGHGEAGGYAPLVKIVLQSLEIAHEVWCSTPALVERVAHVCNGTVELLPNALDPSLWGVAHAPAAPRAGEPLRVLYMGTRTHDADFDLLAEAMRLSDARAPGQVELSMIGVSSNAVIDASWLRVIAPPSHVGASYPAFVHWFRSLRGFDLGVAPLLRSRFNDCKSSIKVLDYAQLGLPALVSDVPAYRHNLIDGVDCLRCENTASAWAESLLEATPDGETRYRIALRARQLVGPDPFDAATAVRRARLLK